MCCCAPSTLFQRWVELVGGFGYGIAADEDGTEVTETAIEVAETAA